MVKKKEPISQSLCFTCKHGICTFQKNRELLSQETVPIDEPETEPWKGDLAKPTGKQQTNSMFVERDGYITICTWLHSKLTKETKSLDYVIGSDFLQHMTLVTECNRYEKGANG